MNANIIRKTGYYFSGFALLLAIGLTLYNQAQKGLWQAEVRHATEQWAYWEARKDLVNGRLRLLRLEGENWELKFSGEHEGPFEIWIPQCFPSISEASKFSKKQYVELYNLNMRNFLIVSKQTDKEKQSNAYPEARGTNANSNP